MAGGGTMGPRIVACALVLTAVTVSCATAQRSVPTGVGDRPRPAAAKRIIAAIRGEPTTFNDAINVGPLGNTAGVREIEQLLSAGLLFVDLNGDPQPQLAEAAPTLDNGLWTLLPD